MVEKKEEERQRATKRVERITELRFKFSSSAGHGHVLIVLRDSKQEIVVLIAEIKRKTTTTTTTMTTTTKTTVFKTKPLSTFNFYENIYVFLSI